jgi:hypothetical protein
MEQEILAAWTKAAKAVGLPPGYDGRAELKKNARGKKWKKRDVEALEGMVWHQELGWGSVESVAEYHTGKESHLARGGVQSIAYTFAVRRDGQVVLCNDFDRAVWSQGYKGRSGDENSEFVSVMFEGLFAGPGVSDPSAGAPNDDQLLAALMLWRVCKGAWEWRECDLYGHFHFGKAACPGSALQSVIETIRANHEEPEHDLTTTTGRQEALASLGFYHGTIDGVWGPRSRGALIRFQEDRHLTADGVWGPNAEAAILRALA